MSELSRRSFGKLALGFTASVLIGGVELRFAQAEEAALETVTDIVAVPDAAADLAAAPSITTTSGWGARPPKQAISLLSQRPTGIIVHHTTSQNTSDTSFAQACSLCRNIQYSHMYERGWTDTGQNFTISRGGYVLEGRHRSLEALNSGSKHCQGAHADGYNGTHVGIECEGLYTSATPPQALYSKLVALCAFICSQYGISPSAIKGHRDVNATACPGDKLYAMLPQLRADVAAVLGGGAPQTWPVLREGDWNRRVTAAEYLLRHRGYNVIVDGQFDPQTTSAVRSFQSANGLTADGVIGAGTFPKLVVTVRRGDSNNAVRAIQALLQITADGIFGPGTESAVMQFQQSQGLGADGIVGPMTWQAAFNKPL